VAAERVIKFLETHNEKQHWLSAWSAADIRAAAAASTQRYAEGRPLSVLDGVPFVVKDCIDALPHPTACGTTFMGEL
jgi:Asp-tRNA(Asn)/Glu-tRNA(Gln) amidotransferase A subunit family amidase